MLRSARQQGLPVAGSFLGTTDAFQCQEMSVEANVTA
jgi:hypothetical protein